MHQQMPIGLGSIQLPEISQSPSPIFHESGMDVGDQVREGIKLDKSPFNRYEGIQGVCTSTVVIDQSQFH